MFDTSPSTEKLDAALSKAQGEFDPAIKDKANPHFKSTYADINSVWEACRDALSKHSVSVTQWPVHSVDNRLHLVTRLAHSGEWIKAEFSVPIGKMDAQGYGTAVTYIKRYSLAAAVGVILGDPESDDDDGNKASGIHPKTPATPQDAKPAAAKPKAEKPFTAQDLVPPKPRMAKDPERQHIIKLAAASRWTDLDVVERMRLLFKKEKILDLTFPEYQELVAEIGSEVHADPKALQTSPAKREDGFGPMFSETGPMNVFTEGN